MIEAEWQSHANLERPQLVCLMTPVPVGHLLSIEPQFSTNADSSRPSRPARVVLEPEARLPNLSIDSCSNHGVES